MKSYLKMWINTFNFSGVAKRSEFWIAIMFNEIISTAILFFNETAGMIFSLVSFIPLLSLTIRRLNDTSQGAKTLFLLFIPIVGWFIVLFTLLKPSQYDRDREFDKYHW